MELNMAMKTIIAIAGLAILSGCAQNNVHMDHLSSRIDNLSAQVQSLSKDVEALKESDMSGDKLKSLEAAINDTNARIDNVVATYKK